MRILRKVDPPLSVAARSMLPVLKHVAGPRAPRVAAVFPAPHTAYFIAPTARRHLIHAVLDGLEVAAFDAPPVIARLAQDLEFARGVDVAERWLGAKASSFVRALGRIGEAPWSEEEYALLRTLMDEPAAATTLRASSFIAARDLVLMQALPTPLRQELIVRQLGSMQDVRLLTEAYDAVVWRLGAHASDVVDRWRRAENANRLFGMALDDVEHVDYAVALYPEHPAVERLESRRDLIRAALEMHNCLSSYSHDAATGARAFYLTRAEPRAALGLERDCVYGWRLYEARGQSNGSLDETERDAIRVIMREMGVWVGRSGCRLISALEERSRGFTADPFDRHDVGDPF